MALLSRIGRVAHWSSKTGCAVVNNCRGEVHGNSEMSHATGDTFVCFFLAPQHFVLPAPRRVEPHGPQCVVLPGCVMLHGQQHVIAVQVLETMVGPYARCVDDPTRDNYKQYSVASEFFVFHLVMQRFIVLLFLVFVGLTMPM